ncbi:MAG: hypothetical protein LBH25_14695 [Fibromonadaceae bacterium]|nr:hypothetical protein [Fibromonadaceae bacterium]
MVAILAFAMAFALNACGDGGDGNSGGSPSSSSSSREYNKGNSSSSSSDDNEENGSCDISDYKTVEIGAQVWMAENLNCYASGSKCYNNNPANCAVYGRLYDWATAMELPSSCNSASCSGQVNAKHRGICPSGWHIPSNEEWATLEDYVCSDKGYGSFPGEHLKSVNGWVRYGGIVSLDSYSFSALPGGLGGSRGNFFNAGFCGYWWSSSERRSSNSHYLYMCYDYKDAVREEGDKGLLYSVRCLED